MHVLGPNLQVSYNITFIKYTSVVTHVELEAKARVVTARRRTRKRIGLKVHYHVCTPLGQLLPGRQHKGHIAPALVVHEHDRRRPRRRRRRRVGAYENVTL